MRKIIQCYKRRSKSARLLSKESGIKRLKKNNSRFVPRPEDKVINWGSSAQRFEDQYYINKPRNVYNAVNKLLAYTCFERMGVSCPEFTDLRHIAEEWNGLVLCRERADSRGGKGILLRDPERELLPICPLYVKYVPKKKEFRIHIYKNSVFDIQEKRVKSTGRNGKVNYQIRSYENNWVFCRENVEAHESLLFEALKAVSALGLDFGAVDIGWNERKQKAFVYEVNTAPGLEGETLKKYAEKFRNLI